MKHTRLLALGALSLLVHVLVIRAIGPAVVADQPAPAAPIAVRLQAPPTPVAPVDETAPPVALAATAPARPAASPATVPAATPAAVAPPPTPAIPTVTPLDNVVALEASMLTRYRVRMPPASTLDYLVTRQDGVQVPAQIAWKTNGNRYTVAANGVTGPLSSVGAIGDTGIAPAEARMPLANGGDITATFGADGITIGANIWADGIASQDQASLLLQLVGMGLAAPDQVAGELAINVATAEGPVVMRFDVTENEDVTTPLGVFSTRRLTQRARPGQARLEIWLAPERDWLPVQLRMTAADGTVTTQAVIRMNVPPAVN